MPKSNDLASANPGIVNALLDEYSQYRMEVGLINHHIAGTEGEVTFSERSRFFRVYLFTIERNGIDWMYWGSYLIPWKLKEPRKGL